MGTPVRRSRRLDGLKPESPGNPTSVSRARRALVGFESNPDETKEPSSPRSPLRQPGLGSPRRQPETSPGSPSLPQDVGSESLRRQAEPCPESPQHRQDPGLVESPRRQLKSSSSCLLPEDPEFAQSMEKSDLGSPHRQLEPSEDPELAKSKEETRPRSPRRPPQPFGTQGGSNIELVPESPRQHLLSGPGSSEPFPAQQVTGPEPSGPLQELKPQSPGSPQGHHRPTMPTSSAKTVSGSIGAKKRKGSSAQAPASKTLKKEVEEVPMIPKGKPKSGRVWKDRSKKRFSQMVQDKPLRTSWQRKMKERQERKVAKDFARHLEEEKERRRQEKKQRRAENLRRRLENERKAEVVQVIRNPAKLKRAKRKQLRTIEKRDTLALLQKQPPQRPATKV
ncbi:coiled-coil domain-containing protein 86 [Rhynchocyon petersi]